jgi:penicillin V acylase-like amidase (Ntn superfamily)
MCTRILWNDNPIATTVARCMDWEVSDEPDLWFVPRGIHRGGHADGDLQWQSSYSSVALSMWRLGTSDGLNEKGLAVHGLYLDPVDVGEWPLDVRPSVPNSLWVQYVLDNFATVAEAVAAVGDIRIAAPELRGQRFGVHLALEDASGDSAIFEPEGDRIVVHHGREFTVMANSPVLDAQLENLARYAPFGGTLAPPGDISSLDRFVRASYFRHYLPQPENLQQAVAGVFQLIQNVSVPYGAPYRDGGGVYPTWWQAGADLTNGVYYFVSTRSPSMFWVNLAELADGTEVLRLDPRDETLVGPSDARFAPATLPY